MYLKSLTNLSSLSMIPLGDRLNNFKILTGESFIPEVTSAEEIGLWDECASFPGNYSSYLILSAEVQNLL